MKVLLAEDNEDMRRSLELMLRAWGYEVVLARDGAEAWEALQTPGAPALILLDWMMPRLDGVQVCRNLRKLEKEPYPYVIMLTARDQMDDTVEALEAGADDFIAKPFNAKELQLRMLAGHRILERSGRYIRARDEMRYRAMHDALTGLWNRAGILEILRKELARSAREHTSTGVVLADLDGFKPINDRLGHVAGDAVLQEVARRMGVSVRTHDSVGRYGGEEFLLVLPNCGLRRVQALAERLRRAIAAKPFPTQAGAVRLTCSFGTVASEQIPGARPMDLVQAADAALYRAKHRGRNQVVQARLEDQHADSVRHLQTG
jgi:two-component system, cell cycle response regulator